MCHHGFALAGRGCAQVASCAQRLLEHSLLTELRGVVGRTLQGVDMFTPAQLAGILGHSSRFPDAHQESSEAQVPVLFMHYIALLLSVVDCCLHVLQKLLSGWLVSSCIYPSYDAPGGLLAVVLLFCAPAVDAMIETEPAESFAQLSLAPSGAIMILCSLC